MRHLLVKNRNWFSTKTTKIIFDLIVTKVLFWNCFIIFYHLQKKFYKIKQPTFLHHLRSQQCQAVCYGTGEAMVIQAKQLHLAAAFRRFLHVSLPQSVQILQLMLAMKSLFGSLLPKIIVISKICCNLNE